MEFGVLKAVFDYFLISIVGFVAGIWIMIGAGMLSFDTKSFDLSGYFEPQPVEPTIDGSVFERIQNKTAKPETNINSLEIDPEATLAWLANGHPFVEELKYLEETNCSDHAMRMYGELLSDLNTDGFDRKTGRLIDADGKVLGGFGWRMIWKSQAFMLQPLQYMKDEHVPSNFKHVMQAIPRVKRNWKTCTFDIPLNARLGGLR
ncbi:hypothetical protein CHH27_08750 [Labrenzia sp. VG12]|nr:hypothetical protein CHH27_08750 [Labrenzia sp. VG12]